VPIVKSSLLDGSSDDLWTDTDDESFVRATQCVLDSAAVNFTSPKPVAFSTAITSTPNVKSSRCRRTFCLESTPTVPHHMKMRPRGAGLGATTCSSLPLAMSSPRRDTSFSDELLATLAEPDDVLDSQLNVIGVAAALERFNPTSATALESNNMCTTKTGMC